MENGYRTVGNGDLDRLDFLSLNYSGPGAELSQRVSADHILSNADAKNFTVDGVFLGKPEWVDFDYKI